MPQLNNRPISRKRWKELWEDLVRRNEVPEERKKKRARSKTTVHT